MFKGRPILGMVSGFMFGLFLGLALFLWGVVPLHSPVLWVAPLVGIVLGLVMAAWAPFGSSDSEASSTAPVGEEPSPASPPPPSDSDMYGASGTTMEQEAIDDPGADRSDQT
ncbi:MAG: hypothetical protein ACR2N2_03605 [Acidimicrobiia bacterium]